MPEPTSSQPTPQTPPPTTSIPSLRAHLIGAWTLIEYSASAPSNPSNKVYPMGPDCTGTLLYTAEGYMSAQLQRPGQLAFHTENMHNATKDEFASAGENYIAYTGPYSVHENATLHHHVTNASFPNWRGSIQKREAALSVEGGETFLTLGPVGMTLDVAGEKLVPRLKWRRLKDNVV